MWNFGIHRDGPNIIKYGNSHPFALQKIKILQRTQILKHCKNSIVHLRCTTLYTNKTLQDIRKSSLIQSHRHINAGRYETKQKLLVGHFRDWDKIKLVFNSNEIKLPKIITIKMQDKIRVRRMMSRETQNFI